MDPILNDALAALADLPGLLLGQGGGLMPGGGGGQGAGGGLGKWMGLIAPISILAMAFKKKGPAWHFLKAGAISAQTARRPRSVEVDNPDQLQGEVRRGVLVATDDGRFWVNEQAYRRWRVVFMGAAAVFAVALGAALFWLFVL